MNNYVVLLSFFAICFVVACAYIYFFTKGPNDI